MVKWFGKSSNNTQKQFSYPTPGTKGTMLEVYLTTMPVATQVQQKTRFASVSANFEFSAFVYMENAEKLAMEIMKKGFTVWVNSDTSSAFFYGAGMIEPDDFSELSTWLGNAAVPGQNIQFAIHNSGEPIKLIEIAV
jgi:hypothetical protein